MGIRQTCFCCLFILLTTLDIYAQKKVCITIDDVPLVSYGFNSIENWRNITEKLLTTLDNKKIPAIGYVNEGKLYKDGVLDSARLAILELWLSRGFELGNHTFSHPDYHKTALKDYTRNIQDGQKITAPLMQKYDQQLKYFRHPYLRIGETAERAKALEDFLDSEKLIPSPVTLDSDDYLFAQKYAMALRKGDEALMKKIGRDYIAHTEKKVKFYEAVSEAIFGRQIAQTYLCHANMLNADYMDELADMFARNGYQFVSQTEVLKDKAYREPVTKFGPWGISWLHRWALSLNKGLELFNNRVQLPDYIEN